MKTTLQIDPELYAAAEQLARSQKKSVAQVVSELLRRALGLGAGADGTALAELERRNGFEVLPERPGPAVTTEDVQRLCREEGISMRALLDVSVLVALLDRKHIAHIKAHNWLASNIGSGWAS